MTEWGQRIQLIWGKNIPFDNFVPLIVEKSFPFFWYVGCWKRWATMGVRRCSRYGLCPTIHLSSICYDEVSDTFFSEAKTTKSKKEVMEEIILKSKFFKVFYGVLLQYFAFWPIKKPLNFKVLNLLVNPLMEMSSEIPYFSAICARQRLAHTRTQFCGNIKNTGKSSWPSLKALFLEAVVDDFSML
ncbi:uncharacterized protein LOC111406176 isoform X1 [Olea europaea var. sylvestris]|uniref:uncharacterized protein LOC111406176 isoform X1 n=1 Tax=Olea europaea var. sylvestris TaxID=158386 RepID=UPI000C1CE8AF|nr:uncharacterized protein LOC111406176 isoform X1 [Olea europaea var. sylvestris]XP_022891189.1 uncharacterized protein LOC111406176 isoform X1 [Olea europaea var. sylvestris]XP_022891190.1 uncharacterized protein LOC111406176 isoform X1 [Olea europaea var. sylvestris]